MDHILRQQQLQTIEQARSPLKDVPQKRNVIYSLFEEDGYLNTIIFMEILADTSHDEKLKKY